MCAPALSALHARFLSLLPKIETHGQIFFRHLRPHQREEVFQEMRALAWKGIDRGNAPGPVFGTARVDGTGTVTGDVHGCGADTAPGHGNDDGLGLGFYTADVNATSRGTVFGFAIGPGHGLDDDTAHVFGYGNAIGFGAVYGSDTAFAIVSGHGFAPDTAGGSDHDGADLDNVNGIARGDGHVGGE